MISFFNNIWQSYGNRLFSSLWPRCIGSAKIPLCALWLCSLFDMMSQCPLNDLNWRRGNVLWLSYDICMGSLLIRWKQTKTFKVSFNNREENHNAHMNDYIQNNGKCILTNLCEYLCWKSSPWSCRSHNVPLPPTHFHGILRWPRESKGYSSERHLYPCGSQPGHQICIRYEERSLPKIPPMCFDRKLYFLLL